MRIVAGIHKGRALATPKSNSIRPTTDRVREAMFNILSHSIDGFTFDDARVLDVFAGTGALGLEALSRGAKFIQFIEQDATARGLIRTNAETLGATGQVKIWRRDATSLSKLESISPFNLVFLDPPYGKGLGDKALTGLVEGGWLAAGAVVVLEELKSAQVVVPGQLTEITMRIYGDTTARFLQG
ncbi:MAG TPA: 16S rRNA (guanine(966)-N(2))-methyltransferase RsmD [Rhizobiales bacterium]|nr:16S rRNA (guanine(966)-N(2))-methyltransferase RsmD [Hyphomicrobiales bacterium]